MTFHSMSPCRGILTNSMSHSTFDGQMWHFNYSWWPFYTSEKFSNGALNNKRKKDQTPKMIVISSHWVNLLVRDTHKRKAIYLRLTHRAHLFRTFKQWPGSLLSCDFLACMLIAETRENSANFFWLKYENYVFFKQCPQNRFNKYCIPGQFSEWII